MPQGVADRRVRTARVDRNFRAVLFAVPPDLLVMAALKPHDEAYAYAKSVRLDINPANGAMELIAEQTIQSKVVIHTSFRSARNCRGAVFHWAGSG